MEILNIIMKFNCIIQNKIKVNQNKRMYYFFKRIIKINKKKIQKHFKILKIL